MRATPETNTLFYGDNLHILREYIADESVDLIYLDPPFNSNASYNVLFKSPAGEESQAQIEAFDDSWHWNDSAERAFDEVMESGNTDAAELLRAMRSFLGRNDMMAYLAMMAVRLIELHRVLKPTGSLYLHCDPTASHYLKILMDAVFGAKCFDAEIIWRRTTSRKAHNRFPRLHDTILQYAKNPDGATFNAIKIPLNEKWLESAYKHEDNDGRYTLDNLTASGTRNGPSGLPWRGHDPRKVGAGRHWRFHPDRLEKLDKEGLIHWPSSGGFPQYKQYLTDESGTYVGDLWTDEQVKLLGRSAKERLGYPTQKPLALLERIINASSNEGDLVLDPFCGCGTTVHAAQKLNRRWIGIDITHLAIGLIQRRLTDAFPMVKYEVLGVPKDAGAAEALAEADKHQFELWALSVVEAQPYKGGRKGADGGVDGYVYFKPDGKTTEKAVVSVKGGRKVGVGMVRDLIATVEREKAKLGVFLTLAPPTRDMVSEAASAGLYKTEYRSYPKIQILTVEELFQGKRPEMPWLDPGAFKKAKLEGRDAGQGKLDI